MINIKEIENIIGYKFFKIDAISTAFTHSSYSHEHGGENYERLELLGDSLLETITTMYLFNNFDDNEGVLSKMRAKVVSAKCLSGIMRGLGLDRYILVGGSINSKEIPDNIVADVYESIVASIMLDGGINSAGEFVLRTLLLSKDNVIDVCNRMIDYKTVLQERLQSEGKHATYNSEEILDNGKIIYRVALLIDGVIVAHADDISKKLAQEEVAKKYLEKNGGIF